MAVDAQGNNLGRPGQLPAGLPVAAAVTAAASSSDGRDLRLASVSTGDGEGGVTVVPVRVLTQRVATPVGDAFVQVIGDRRTEQQTLDAIRTVLIVGGLLVVLVAFGFGTFYARRALVPIRESLVQQRAALRRQR